MNIHPDRATCINGKIIEEFRWMETTMVFIDSKRFDGTFDEACRKAKEEESPEEESLLTWRQALGVLMVTLVFLTPASIMIWGAETISSIVIPVAVVGWILAAGALLFGE